MAIDMSGMENADDKLVDQGKD